MLAVNEGNGALSIFEVVIQSYRFDQFKPKHRFDRFKANQVYELQRLTYLRPHLRIIQALQALPQSELMTDILSPSISSYNLDSSHDREPDWWKNYPLISKVFNEYKIIALLIVFKLIISFPAIAHLFCSLISE